MADYLSNVGGSCSFPFSTGYFSRTANLTSCSLSVRGLRMLRMVNSQSVSTMLPCKRRDVKNVVVLKGIKLNSLKDYTLSSLLIISDSDVSRDQIKESQIIPYLAARAENRLILGYSDHCPIILPCHKAPQSHGRQPHPSQIESQQFCQSPAVGQTPVFCF